LTYFHINNRHAAYAVGRYMAKSFFSATDFLRLLPNTFVSICEHPNNRKFKTLRRRQYEYPKSQLR
ncbi:MAG: hypothetical protein WD625_04480, partial [Balneolales bacterium]